MAAFAEPLKRRYSKQGLSTTRRTRDASIHVANASGLVVGVVCFDT